MITDKMILAAVEALMVSGGLSLGASVSHEAMRAALEAADRAAWEPIESAPKDGTPFLAYWMRFGTDGRRYEASSPFVVASELSGRLFPLWVDEEDPPTHWRPLPCSPEDK